MRQLSGLDASFLYLDEQNADTHGTLVLVYDTSTAAKRPIRFKDILAQVKERLGNSRLFRQKLATVPLGLDHPYWVDDPDFDIEYHVRHVALPKPADWRQFCILASRMHATPLDMSRPLWEMVVVEGLENVAWLPPGSCAILLKAHHCALDGHTAAEMTMALHNLTSDGSVRAPVNTPPFEIDEHPGLPRMLARAWKATVLSPFRLARPALRVSPGLGRTIADFFANVRKRPERHALTRFNHKLSPHRVFTARGFALDDIRRLRLAVPGATVNDAVLSVCAGAIRHYLKAHRESVAAPLRVGMPINTRLEREFGTGGNSISAMYCEAHIDCADAIERLRRVYRSTGEAKELSDAIGAREMTDLQRHSPVAISVLAMKTMNATRWGGLLGAPFANFCISNVPGPTVPLYLCGAELKYFSVVAPLPQGIGLFFAVSSYCDRLFISPTADRTMLPDPKLFESCIDRSFKEHVAGAEKLFARYPELLAAANKPQPGRRQHPGMAAMGRGATPTPGAKTKAAKSTRQARGSK